MSEMSAAMLSYPTYGVDLFTPEALLDPFPHYRAIQDLGPVVRIEEPRVLALSRYHDVVKALQTPDILVSGQGTGFNSFINQKVAEPGVLNSDGERHKRMRLPLMKYLSPVALKPLRDSLNEMMDAEVAGLVDGETRDAISTLAAYLPVKAVSELVGLPDEHRAKMIKWSAASFNVLGVIEQNGQILPELADDLALAGEVMDYIRNLDPAELRPGSWSAELFQQVHDGGMSLADARVSLRAFVLPSLDTTINAMGNLLYLLGRYPDQYALVRENPALIPSAVYEGMRHSSIIRWFSRVAGEDYRAGDVFVPAGERIMILFGAANRDPRKYPDPDKFDVTRNPIDQLTWSAGPHLCAGKHLARMEMEALLAALVKHVARLEVDEPTRPVNRGIFGMNSLPIRLFAT